MTEKHILNEKIQKNSKWYRKISIEWCHPIDEKTILSCFIVCSDNTTGRNKSIIVDFVIFKKGDIRIG